MKKIYCPYCGEELEDVGCYKLDCVNPDCEGAGIALEASQWKTIANRNR